MVSDEPSVYESPICLHGRVSLFNIDHQGLGNFGKSKIHYLASLGLYMHLRTSFGADGCFKMVCSAHIS